MAALDCINDIPELNNRNVFIQDKADLSRKIIKLKSDGVNNLQIVTDFDLTLTRHVKDDNTAVPTTYDMFTECPSVPEEYKKKNRELAEFYRPHETDATLSKDEKTAYMVEWYTKVNKALLHLTMPWEELKVQARKLMIPWLRTGVSDLIAWTEKNEVPLLIFSAGMGECVRTIMKESDLKPQNVKFISNFCKLDADNKIIGIKGEIIHPLNKNETAIKGNEYYDMVKSRSNVIVMGDSVGDAGMADGMEHCAELIKIGFLGREVDNNRDLYRKTFDIVLENDNTMNVVNALLQYIA